MPRLQGNGPFQQCSVGQRLVGRRTALINQVRAILLERRRRDPLAFRERATGHSGLLKALICRRALADQRRQLVLDQFGATPILEARGEAIDQPHRPIRGAQQQRRPERSGCRRRKPPLRGDLRHW